MYYVEYKNEEGWTCLKFEDDALAATEAYNKYSEVYRFVTLKRDTVVTSTEIVLDSGLEAK